MDDGLICPICKSKMVTIYGTPLCMNCGKYEVYESYAFIKYDIEEVNKNGNIIMR